MDIKKGKLIKPKRVVIYGTEGIGKSSLAALLTANPLFIDVEEGTGDLDVARLEPTSMAQVRAALQKAIASKEHTAVVVDTIDWVEHRLAKEMLDADSKVSIEDYGYGGGFTKLAEQLMEFLGLLDKVLASGKHVILLGHAQVKRYEAPGDSGGYDRYSMKLSKKGGPLVSEWADYVLFLNYVTTVVEGKDKKKRAKGGTDRVICTERCAAYDAKHRGSMADKIEFDDPATVPPELAAIFSAWKPVAPKDPTAVDSSLAEIIKGVEAEALAFALERKMLKPGEGFSMLSDAHLLRIKSDPKRFLALAQEFAASSLPKEEPATAEEKEPEAAAA